jgi:hypothetical protein
MKWPENAKKVSLFDPSRPQINERPGLLRPDGSSMHAIVPSLSIDILTPLRSGEDVTCELWAFVWYGPAAKRLSFPCSAYNIPSILEQWEECPEHFLVTRMSWEPQAQVAKEVQHFSAGAPPAGVRVLSLDDVEF